MYERAISHLRSVSSVYPREIRGEFSKAAQALERESELERLLDHAVRDWVAIDGKADDFGRKTWVAEAQDRFGIARDA